MLTPGWCPVASDGDVVIEKFLKDRRVTLGSFKTPTLKKGAGQTNHLELRLKEKGGTLFINDSEVARFKSKKPKGEHWIGILAASADARRPTVFKFDNFVMNAVPVGSSSALSSRARKPQGLSTPDLVAKPDTTPEQ